MGKHFICVLVRVECMWYDTNIKVKRKCVRETQSLKVQRCFSDSQIEMLQEMSEMDILSEGSQGLPW